MGKMSVNNKISSGNNLRTHRDLTNCCTKSSTQSTARGWTSRRKKCKWIVLLTIQTHCGFSAQAQQSTSHNTSRIDYLTVSLRHYFCRKKMLTSSIRLAGLLFFGGHPIHPTQSHVTGTRPRISSPVLRSRPKTTG